MSAVDETHPVNELDDLIHQKTRLGILTVLAEAGRADFQYVRDVLELTDGNLSRHLQVLAGESLIEIDKGYEDNRPRTWIEITPDGRRALRSQIAILRELVHRVENA